MVAVVRRSSKREIFCSPELVATGNLVEVSREFRWSNSSFAKKWLLICFTSLEHRFVAETLKSQSLQPILDSILSLLGSHQCERGSCAVKRREVGL